VDRHAYRMCQETSRGRRIEKIGIRKKNVGEKLRIPWPEMGLHSLLLGARGGVVAEALRYKLECRGFDSRWCHWNFHCYNPSGRTLALGSTQRLTEMSTRNIFWR
jgi:hypothetical protein